MPSHDRDEPRRESTGSDPTPSADRPADVPASPSSDDEADGGSVARDLVPTEEVAAYVDKAKADAIEAKTSANQSRPSDVEAD